MSLATVLAVSLATVLASALAVAIPQLERRVFWLTICIRNLTPASSSILFLASKTHWIMGQAAMRDFIRGHQWSSVALT